MADLQGSTNAGGHEAGWNSGDSDRRECSQHQGSGYFENQDLNQGSMVPGVPSFPQLIAGTSFKIASGCFAEQQQQQQYSEVLDMESMQDTNKVFSLLAALTPL